MRMSTPKNITQKVVVKIAHFYLIGNRFSILDAGKSNKPPSWRITIFVSNLQLFEDWSIKQNPIGLMSSHDEPSSLWVTLCIVRIGFGYVELENSPSSFLPSLSVPRVKIDPR